MMEIKFEKPCTPNYIRTNKGIFSLAELSKEELSEYAKIWCDRLKERRKEQRGQKK